MTFQTCYVWARPSHHLKSCQECLETHDTSNTIYNATFFKPFFNYCGKRLANSTSTSSQRSVPQPTADEIGPNLVDRTVNLTTEPSMELPGTSPSTFPPPFYPHKISLTRHIATSPIPTSTSAVETHDWITLSVIGPIFLIIFVSIVLLSLSFKRITLWRHNLKLQERVLKELEEREIRSQLHGESMQLVELKGRAKVDFELEDTGTKAEIEGEGWRVELPAREVVGVELEGKGKVRRKPVPGRPGTKLDEGQTLGMWAGIGRAGVVGSVALVAPL